MEKKRSELVKRLSDLIREPGAFPSGQLPPERELAKSLGVSRNLLREAIITMDALGLLEIRERQGTFIAEPGAADFAGSLKFLAYWPDDILPHLMEARLCVEPPAAFYAAARRSDYELERMRDCVEHLEKVHTDLDRGLASGAVWDSNLHALIVNASRNPVLGRMYEGLASTMERYITISRTKLLVLHAWPGNILEEHRRIVRAIADRDGDAAAAALREHLSNALKKLNELGDAQGGGR